MLSVVITAWNEEKNLPRAVRSVSDIADEIIVVDTESTDNTVEEAKKLGCKVYNHKFLRIVEPVRNFSISKASGDWILLLDADEEIPPSLAREIKKIISTGSADYVRFPRKNLIFGRWIKSAHWWPDYVYRLFKKGHITWKETIHSLPLTQGKGADIPPQEDLAIIHHNYSDISQYLDRMNRYTDVQADQLLETKYKFSWLDLLNKPADEFLSQYFARRGFAEGVHGLALALLQSFSSLLVYLKLWQHSGFPQVQITPEHMRRQLSTYNRQLKWWYYQTRIDSASTWLKPLWKLLRRI